MKYLLRAATLIALVLFVFATGIPAQDPATDSGGTPPPLEPAIAEASDEAERAMQVFILPDGVSATVFAAEPSVANPVAIDVDPHGRVFVCESYRQEKGIEDNRNHPEWLNEDLAAQTVADRLAYIDRHLGDQAIEYTRQDDRIRLVTDTDGDGIADQSTVFAKHFNAIEEGTGAGVLFVDGDVYYTCIPRLWKLVDGNLDGVSEQSEVLHEGFGVRFAFRGHDLHGLILGPDGRLYFSIGDRGYYVNEEISDPSSGAVFRCELDGSNLEVYATGLRNPQELAFDDYGNLFTGDNNSDSGDRARMVYVVEGGDSGWRMEYQYLPDRGPFNREKIWHPYDPETTPAYIVPPIDNFADGPSGFGYYPGTGFSEHMNERFLLCDFRGQTTGSGIKTFRLRPLGAFFEVVDEENTFWNILATDCCFGPDGRLYVSDWVHGWDGLGKGRVYAFADSGGDRAAIEQVQQLLGGDWTQQHEGQLLRMLNHADRRVRMQAQFELVRRDRARMLETAARFSTWKLGRLHGLWGLDQLSRAKLQDGEFNQRFAKVLQEMLACADPEVRTQATRLSGELLSRSAANLGWRASLIRQLLPLLDNEHARLQYAATIALGKAGVVSSVNEIAGMLAANNNRDPILRHGAIMALAWLTSDARSASRLNFPAAHESAAVRLATVVALRKLSQRGQVCSELLEKLLGDSDPRVVLEVARAIHDVPIPGMMPSLAKLSEYSAMPDALARRVINANFHMGSSESLQRIKGFILDESQILERRAEAIEMLGQWSAPPPLDKVLGMWRPIDAGGRVDARRVADELIATLDTLEPTLAYKALRVAAEMKLQGALGQLRSVVESGSDAARRVWALKAYLNYNPIDKQAIIEFALASDQSLLRMEACRQMALDGDVIAMPHLRTATQSNETAERQNAVSILGELEDAESAEILRQMLLQFDKVPDDTQLDLWLAAENRQEEVLKQLFNSFLQQREAEDPQFRYRMTMYGGDADAGTDIFYDRADVSCLRCHKIQGSGGDVGPNLSDIGAKRDRALLLESLIDPNKTITENFETVVVLDLDGNTHVGVPKASANGTLSIMTADAIMVHIRQEDIDDMRRGQSAMPDDVTKNLKLGEIRDLIEFLAAQKTPEQTSQLPSGHDE